MSGSDQKASKCSGVHVGQHKEEDGETWVCVSITKGHDGESATWRPLRELQDELHAPLWFEAKVGDRVHKSQPGDTVKDVLAAVRRLLVGAP